MTLTARHCLVLLAFAAGAACDRAPESAPAGKSATDTTGGGAPPTAWLIGPRREADLLDSTATEVSLRARFGSAAVRTDSVYVGEGQSELGTILFPDDSARELAIVWDDRVARSRPAFVYVSSSRSAWRVYPGVGIGTDLRTLDSLNGRGFHLSGFNWDYSGTTTSFDQGRLDSLWRRDTVLGQAVLLRLSPSDSAAPESLLRLVQGEREFSSRDSAMQRLNPRVYQVLVRPR